MKDSTGEGLPGAYIQLVCGKDTLKTLSKKEGAFSFSSPRCKDIVLIISSFGYASFRKSFFLKEDVPVIVLQPVILLPESKLLDEIIVHKKAIPVRLKKDTVEYDASAFIVRDADRVEDLLKQMPGIEIDKDGNVTSMGKPMTKLRVNGKDFFTNDVKEYIRQLPADMIARLQVIDDYGDKASFTGIKSGEPKKMLNLITKKGRDHVDFLNANASAGTDSRYVVGVNTNRWRNSKQIAFNGGINNVNSGAGISNATSLSANYRDKWGKTLTGSVSYYYSDNHSESSSTSLSETSSSLGTIYNESSSESSARSGNHSLNIGINNNGNTKNFIDAALSIGLSDSKNISNTISRQTGVIKQDLTTGSIMKQHSPSVNASGSWAHSFTKKRRLLALGFSLNNADNNNDNDLINRIGYYESGSGLPAKDSLLHLMVNTNNKVLRTGVNFSFSEPAGKNSDIYFTYLFSGESNNNRLLTRAEDEGGVFNSVDSLSNIYRYSYNYHQAAFNYRYGNQKLTYLVGFGVQPDVLTGRYEGRTEKVSKVGFNITPLFNFNYLLSARRSFSFNYRTNNKPPEFLQLQPVRDTRNLQNVITGNPDLKAAFIHTAVIEYRVADPEKSASFQTGISGSYTRNQVVTNALLIPDSIYGFKQETRYLNANGVYGLVGYYSWFTFLKAKVLSLEVQGNVSYDQNVSLTDNSRNLSKNFSFSQSVRVYYNKPWINVSSQVAYENRINRYTLAEGRSTEIESWTFSMDGRVFFLKTYSGGLNTSLRLNKGYSIDVPNPLIIHVFTEKWLSKKKRTCLRFSVNDLLNKGSNFSRNITSNSITDTRTNQVKRFFLLGFTLRLQNTPVKAITPPSIVPFN